MSRKILIVDDDARMLRALHLRLRNDYEVLLAGPDRPLQQALELWVRHADLTLALLDLHMPDTQGRLTEEAGFQLLQQLKTARPKARIAIHTAYDKPENRESAARRGAEGFFVRARTENPLEDTFDQDIQALANGVCSFHVLKQEGMTVRTLSDREQKRLADYETALNDPQVRRAYAGKVVAWYRGEVLGSGRKHTEARAAAEEHLGWGSIAHDELIVVAIPGPPAGAKRP